jgi:serine/threonine-protein kinase
MRGIERQRERLPIRAGVSYALIAGTLRHARAHARDTDDMVAQRRPRMAPWGPTASSAETRAYVQQRLALFVKTMFWISWGLIGFLIAAYEVYPHARPQGADYVHPVAICGLIFMGLIWITQLARRQPPLEVLYAIDLVVTLGIGLVFGLSAYVSHDKRAAVWTAFIFVVFIVMGRALILPSSPRRTLVVSGLGMVPLAAAGIAQAAQWPEQVEFPPVAFMIGDVFLCCVTVMLATIGSGVIYGLRRQVSEAMQLGQYTLDEKIGEGGMGVVYRAHHAMLRRPTAIKLLPPAKLGAESLKRFEREVHHMSQLTHPNTVAVFDYGRSPDGVFYYAMEYLDGIDLETLVKLDGPQPAPRVVHILRQICGALDEAHGLGLTHRDIKPANVILCRRGNQPDVAKVVDFGLVKEIARETSEHSSAHVILGTPAFLAPEGVTEPETVGPLADLYALGALGYYLLTAKRVFEGKTVIDICVQHVNAVPPPMAARTTNAIPGDLEALILRCLEKRPEDRPASARELRAALAALPVYQEWDEGSALMWWEKWAERREAAKAAASGNGQGDLGTMTVDLRERTPAKT